MAACRIWDRQIFVQSSVLRYFAVICAVEAPGYAVLSGCISFVPGLGLSVDKRMVKKYNDAIGLSGLRRGT